MLSGSTLLGTAQYNQFALVPRPLSFNMNHTKATRYRVAARTYAQCPLPLFLPDQSYELSFDFSFTPDRMQSEKRTKAPFIQNGCASLRLCTISADALRKAPNRLCLARL